MRLFTYHRIAASENGPACIRPQVQLPDDRRLHQLWLLPLTRAHRFRRSILRQLKMRRAWLFSLRALERFAHRLRYGSRVVYLGVPFRDRPKHGDEVDELV